MPQGKDEIERLDTLIRINSLINSSCYDAGVLYSHILESAEMLIGSDASSLLLIDDETGDLYFEVALGEKGEDVKKYTLSKDEGIAGWVARNDRSLIVNDVENDERYSSKIAKNTGYETKNLIAVPLRVKEQIIGVLEVINKTKDRVFSDDDVRLLEVLADQAAIALQNTKNSHQNSSISNLTKRSGAMRTQADRVYIWQSPISGKLLEETKKMASSGSPVLILGESGVGKELIAEHIHRSSACSSFPLIQVNCAALPKDLMESELFGHVEGAFTDALRDKKGYFERADGGTLFLDEIGELNAKAQAKILHVLQNGRFQRVGGEQSIHVDVRIIAATNRNLIEAVAKTVFRKDLYFRLAVLTVEVPPLRARPEDIEALARHFLTLFRHSTPDSPSEFSLEAIEALLSYRWPGNVRELQNAVERAAISARGKSTISPEDLAIGDRTSSTGDHAGRTLKESVNLFKKNFIREVLKEHGGNQTLSAKALGIQRTYLSRIIKNLSIKFDEE